MYVIRAARPEEWSASLDCLLRVPRPGSEASQKHHLLLENLNDGTLDAAGLIIALEHVHIRGAVLGQALGGAQAFVFDVPGLAEGVHEPLGLQIQLLESLWEWLHSKSVRVAHCLVRQECNDSHHAFPRAGCPKITELHFFHRELPNETYHKPAQLDFIECTPEQCSLLAQTISHTYQYSLDCPELNDLLSPEEILQGYVQAVREVPAWWWRIRQSENEVGVLFLHEFDAATCEIRYIGLVPAARGKGLGEEVLAAACDQAARLGFSAMQVCVDERNLPAMRLYVRFGFSLRDTQTLFLKRIH